MPPSAPADAHELAVERHIAAPPERVWQVMTERLAEWWRPKPWSTEVVALEWRPGGRNAMVMRGPDGEVSPMEGVFLDVVPGERFVFTDAFTAGWVPQTAFMVGMMSITPDGDGTRYRGSARHWTEVARQQHEAMGFAEGWAKVAEQLAALCEGG